MDAKLVSDEVQLLINIHSFIIQYIEFAHQILRTKKVQVQPSICPNFPEKNEKWARNHTSNLFSTVVKKYHPPTKL